MTIAAVALAAAAKLRILCKADVPSTWGSRVSSVIAQPVSDRVVGAHVSFVPLQRPHQAVDGEQLEDWERRGIRRGDEFIARPLLCIAASMR